MLIFTSGETSVLNEYVFTNDWTDMGVASDKNPRANVYTNITK